MRNGRFTLFDLVVAVVVLVGLLLLAVVVFRPTGRARELAKTAGCGMNLSAIGKAVSLYKASYRDQYPHINGSASGWLNDIGSADREAVENPGGDQPAVDLPVSRLMWLFVREGQPAAAFICPSTADMECTKVQRPAPQDPGKLIYYWDFEPTSTINGKTQCSYAFQVPAVDDKGKVLPGINDNCDEQMPIMADRNPARGQANWAPATPDPAVRVFMSQNHTKGEYMNFLRAGGSVANDSTPMCGTITSFPRTPGGSDFLRDHIFTAAGHKSNGRPDTTAETVPSHLNNVKDSFLYIQKVPDGTEPRP